MTLPDDEYQGMRDAAIAIIREIGVEAGGCNIQFAVNPVDGEMLVIEMNPRRSEERRVGEEWRSRWSPYHLKKKKKNEWRENTCTKGYLSAHHVVETEEVIQAWEG